MITCCAKAQCDQLMAELEEPLVASDKAKMGKKGHEKGAIVCSKGARPVYVAHAYHCDSSGLL